MASFSQVSREEKRRIASELHDNLAARAQKGPLDDKLDPLIPKLAASRDNLTGHVDDKTVAETSRGALLAVNDVDDDEVDRWYRHIYRFTEVELLRRHAKEHVSIAALLEAGYPDGLAHVDDRIPDQNEHVGATLSAYREQKHAATLAAMEFPMGWLDKLEAAVGKSAASFAAYEATFGDRSTAVSLGLNEEEKWVTLMRELDLTIRLRSLNAAPEVVEEGKRLMAPLTNAVRLLRSESRSRATKKEKSKPEEPSKEEPKKPAEPS